MHGILDRTAFWPMRMKLIRMFIWRHSAHHNRYELSVHINDLTFISQICPTLTKNVEKPKRLVGIFGNNDMAFGTVSHKTHHVRRNDFNVFFPAVLSGGSSRPIRQIICERIKEYQASGCPINFLYAYSALVLYTVSSRSTALPVVETAFYSLILIRSRMVISRRRRSYPRGGFETMRVSPALMPIDTSRIKQFPYMILVMSFCWNWFVQTVIPLASYLRARRKS
jgi:hypothetical protein